jgi:hypothetical protein
MPSWLRLLHGSPQQYGTGKATLPISNAAMQSMDAKAEGTLV